MLYLHAGDVPTALGTDDCPSLEKVVRGKEREAPVADLTRKLNTITPCEYKIRALLCQ